LKITKKILSEEQIQERIIKLASEINTDYEGKNLIILGVLKGAFIAISDLAKNLNIDVSFEFMSISSYEGSESTGQIKIEKDLDIDISGKNILIVEDIFDTGLTLSSLIDILESRNPKSIEIMCMFVKSVKKKIPVKISIKVLKLAQNLYLAMGLTI
jgi:Hypoxanthine-guanine phosphoribosyltransferase